MHALVLASLSAALAPAPVYKPLMTKEMESLRREADRNSEEARRLWDASHRLPTPERRKAMLEEASRFYRVAAKGYTRVSDMIEEKRPRGGARGEADDVAMKAGHAWLQGGRPADSLAAYERVANRSPDPIKRVRATGRCVAALVWLGRGAEVGKRLAAIRKDLPSLPDEEREQWEVWLKAAETTR